MNAWLYILRLKSGQLYIGSTTDIGKRYQDHQNGNACRTTKLDPAVKVVYSESLPTFSDARKREAQIKRWSRAKKEALVAGDLEKLQTLSKSRKNDTSLSQLGNEKREISKSRQDREWIKANVL